MTEEKKATEVIQEIKAEVDEILSYIKNMDFKYNLILNQLNKLVSFQSSPTTIEKIVERDLSRNIIKSTNSPTVEASDVNFPEYQPKKSQFDQASNLKSKLSLALEQAQKDQDESDKIEVAAHQDGKRRNLRQHSEAQIRQIPTQQRITYADGKAVYMAGVEIFDTDEKLINQTKTNHIGKWLAPLSPGTYLIKVTKGSSALKPKVELSYQVTIPNQDSTVDLGTKVVES